MADRLSSLQSLLQGIQHEVGSGRTRHLPADNAPGKNVNHEGDIDEALPSRDLREIRYLKWTPLSRQLLVEFKVVPLRLLVTG